MVDGGISMGKTYYQIIAFYDGNKTAREIMTDVIVRKVRKNLAEDIEKSYGKEYNQNSSQNKNTESLSGLCG